MNRADIIARRMDELGLSVAEVHRQLVAAGRAITYQAVHNWYRCRGGIDVENLRALRVILGLSDEEILGVLGLKDAA
jgi:hypothetical protein